MSRSLVTRRRVPVGGMMLNLPNVEVSRPDSMGGSFVYSCKMPAAVG